jgi:hypothetical protein
MPEKCYVSQFPGVKINLIFHNFYYERKCFISTGVLSLNSYKISPIEENSKWRNCVVIGDEDYDLLACGAVYSVRNLPKFWRNILFEDGSAKFLQNVDETVQCHIQEDYSHNIL